MLRPNGESGTYALLFLVAVFWGAQPAFIIPALDYIDPKLLAFWRYSSIAVLMLGYLFWKHGLSVILPRKWWISVFFMGLFGAAGNNMFQFVGLSHSTAINCTLVSAITPTMTAALAALFLREKLSLLQWGGVALSFFGVVLIVVRGSLDVLLALTVNVGDIFFVLGQLCWAIYSVIGRRVMREVSPTNVTAWASFTGTLTMPPLLAFFDVDIVVPHHISTYAMLIYMVFLSGILATIWWNSGIKKVGAGRTAIFLNVMPLVGIVLAVSFLGERIIPAHVIGGIVILTGVWLTTQQERVAALYTRIKG